MQYDIKEWMSINKTIGDICSSAMVDNSMEDIVKNNMKVIGSGEYSIVYGGRLSDLVITETMKKKVINNDSDVAIKIMKVPCDRHPYHSSVELASIKEKADIEESKEGLRQIIKEQTIGNFLNALLLEKVIPGYIMTRSTMLQYNEERKLFESIQFFDRANTSLEKWLKVPHNHGNINKMLSCASQVLMTGLVSVKHLDLCNNDLYPRNVLVRQFDTNNGIRNNTTNQTIKYVFTPRFENSIACINLKGMLVPRDSRDTREVMIIDNVSSIFMHTDFGIASSNLIIENDHIEKQHSFFVKRNLTRCSNFHRSINYRSDHILKIGNIPPYLRDPIIFLLSLKHIKNKCCKPYQCETNNNINIVNNNNNNNRDEDVTPKTTQRGIIPIKSLKKNIRSIMQSNSNNNNNNNNNNNSNNNSHNNNNSNNNKPNKDNNKPNKDNKQSNRICNTCNNLIKIKNWATFALSYLHELCTSNNITHFSSTETMSLLLEGFIYSIFTEQFLSKVGIDPSSSCVKLEKLSDQKVFDMKNTPRSNTFDTEYGIHQTREKLKHAILTNADKMHTLMKNNF